jgi:hypothetical protein
MRSSRRLSLAAAVVAVGAAAGGAGATAHPAAAAEAHYLASFEGTVHAKWDEPRHMTYRDCYRSWMYEGHGEETWRVWSTGTNKVRVMDNGAGPQLEFGTFEYTDMTPDPGLKAKGTRDRSRTDTVSFDPGSCGTLQEPMMDPPAPKDCGTRMINYLIELTPEGTTIHPDVLMHDNGIREKLDYTNCPINSVESWVPGTWPEAEGKLMYKGKPVKSFFGTEDKLVAEGKWSDDGRKEMQWGGVLTGSVSVTWKLTLTRVGGKAGTAPKPTKKAKPKKKKGKVIIIKGGKHRRR